MKWFKEFVIWVLMAIPLWQALAGCASLNNPPGSPCESGVDCSSGICQDGTCRAPVGATATKSNECIDGAKLEDGVCKAPASGSCKGSSECATGICQGGTCRVPNGSPATSVSACADGAQLEDGVCEGDVGAGCSTTTECLSTLECAAGACAEPKKVACAACSSDADCLGGICVGGTCLAAAGANCTIDACCPSSAPLCFDSDGDGAPTCSPPQTTVGTPCSTAAHCGDGLTCVDQHCLLAIGQPCTADSACSSQHCIGDSVCGTAQAQPFSACAKDADCAVGLGCPAGQCLGTVGYACDEAATVCAPSLRCVRGACAEPLPNGADCSNLDGAASDAYCASGLCYDGPHSCGPPNQGEVGAPCSKDAECNSGDGLTCNTQVGECLLPGPPIADVKTARFAMDSNGDGWDDSNPVQCWPLPEVTTPAGYETFAYIHSIQNGDLGRDKCEDSAKFLVWHDMANHQVCARISGKESSFLFFGCKCNCDADHFEFSVTVVAHNPSKLRFQRVPLSNDSCARPDGYPTDAPCLSLAENFFAVNIEQNDPLARGWQHVGAIEMLGMFPSDDDSSWTTTVASFIEVFGGDAMTGYDTSKYLVFAAALHYFDCHPGGMVGANGLVISWHPKLEPALTQKFIPVSGALGAASLQFDNPYGADTPALWMAQVRSYDLRGDLHPVGDYFFRHCGLLAYASDGNAVRCDPHDQGGAATFPGQTTVTNLLEQGAEKACNMLKIPDLPVIGQAPDICGSVGDVVGWAVGKIGQMFTDAVNGCGDGPADDDASWTVRCLPDTHHVGCEFEVRNGNENSRVEVVLLGLQFPAGS